MLPTVLVKHWSTMIWTACYRNSENPQTLFQSNRLILFLSLSFSPSLQPIRASFLRDVIIKFVTYISHFSFCTVCWVRQLYIVIFSKWTVRSVANVKWHRTQLVTLWTLPSGASSHLYDLFRAHATCCRQSGNQNDELSIDVWLLIY
jgi:hypothetical protein